MGYVGVAPSCQVNSCLIASVNIFNVRQMRLLGECRGSIDAVKKMGFELKEEEDAVSGLADPSSSESQTSGNTIQPLTPTCFS